MNSRLTILCILIIPFILSAQNGRLALIAEGSGAGGLYSFNVDYTVYRSKSDKLRCSLTAGYSNAILKYSRYEYFPVRASILIGTNTPFHWELGLAYTSGSFGQWIYAEKRWDQWKRVHFILPTLGIRYQKPHSGFVFKAYFIPIFNQSTKNLDFLRSISRGPQDGFMNLWYGIGAGYAF